MIVHSARPVILLTGFGPFPGVKANATAALVPELAEAASRALGGWRIVAEVLPTEWQAGPVQLGHLLERHRPAVALHFGVSSRATGFEIEARARNAASVSVTDAAGVRLEQSCISSGGADFLPASLPAQHVVERLRRRGLPAVLSRDAGTYLCNAILYSSLERALASPRQICSGFIHVPVALGARSHNARAQAGCRLAWDDAIDGGIEIMAAAVGLPPRPRRVAQSPR